MRDLTRRCHTAPSAYVGLELWTSGRHSFDLICVCSANPMLQNTSNDQDKRTARVRSLLELDFCGAACAVIQVNGSFGYSTWYSSLYSLASEPGAQMTHRPLHDQSALYKRHVHSSAATLPMPILSYRMDVNTPLLCSRRLYIGLESSGFARNQQRCSLFADFSDRRILDRFSAAPSRFGSCLDELSTWLCVGVDPQYGRQ